MANTIYPKAKEQMWQGGINASAGTVKAVLVDTADYTYGAAHEFFSDVPAAARVGTPQTLGSKTFTNGVFDAADITFPTVTGDQSEAIVVYIDTGVEATSRLLLYYDTGVTGLPITPNGSNISTTWHASGLAAL